MKVQLLAGFTEDEKKEKKALLYGSAQGLKIVEDHLRKRVEELQKARLGSQDYASPSWALLQADKVGEIRAYLEIIELLTLDREKENG